MKKLLLLAGLFAFLPYSAKAQLIPKGEVYVGYSYLRAQASPSNTNLNGWTGSLNLKPTSWLGFVGDFAGEYGTISGFTSHENTYLFGPQVNLPGPVSPFAHALFGLGHINEGGATDSSFAAALGGGIDLRIMRHVALRAIEGDYVRTKFFGATQNDARVSAGIVLRF